MGRSVRFTMRTCAAGAAAAVLVILFLASEPGASLQTSCVVALAAGDVQGRDLGASCAYLGIPYAASTAGSNRWKAPHPVQPWAPALLDATTPPQGCPSAGMGAGPFTGIEDCLKLNVWIADPLPESPAPVIVWLHTGAFLAASANFAGTNGNRLARETGVVVVAPNYRLGALGFLVHPALDAEAGVSGNYGILDQQAALRWVRDNIARFGGDPGNVTLAGTSAGGQSVGMHLVSPGSEGLFHRAIVQSAYPTSRWDTAAEAAVQGQAFAAALGCTDAACMRLATQNVVLTALPQASQQVVEPATQFFWEPVVDGSVIPDQPRTLLEQGRFHQVPTIIGFNRDEGWGPFINRSFPSGVSLGQYESWLGREFGPLATSIQTLYPADVDPASPVPPPVEAMARVVGDVQFACEARRLARLIEPSRAPVYLYSYEYLIDAPSVDHVVHGVESNIIFGNDYLAPIFTPHALDDRDNQLHVQMSGYWSRFAAAGNPNTDDESVVRWLAFRRPSADGRGADKAIVFDADIREGMRQRERQCDFFEPFFFRSVLGVVPASPQ